MRIALSLPGVPVQFVLTGVGRLLRERAQADGATLGRVDEATRCSHDELDQDLSHTSAPAAIIATPPPRATNTPAGPPLPARTKIAIAATQTRFITPTTKSTPIRTQQQPRQY